MVHSIVLSLISYYTPFLSERVVFVRILSLAPLWSELKIFINEFLVFPKICVASKLENFVFLCNENISVPEHHLVTDVGAILRQ